MQLNRHGLLGSPGLIAVRLAQKDKMLVGDKDTGHLRQEDLEPQYNLRESSMNQKTANKKYLVLVGFYVFINVELKPFEI